MKQKKGFTLVEIMIVVAVVALLSAVAIPNLLLARRKAFEADAQVRLHNMASLLESYAAEQGEYPDGWGRLINPGDGGRPYTTINYCDGILHGGYFINCAPAGGGLAAAGYTIQAVRRTEYTGSTCYQISTGVFMYPVPCPP